VYTDFILINYERRRHLLPRFIIHNTTNKMMGPGTGYAGTGYGSAPGGYAGMTGYGAPGTTGYGAGGYGSTPGISELQMQQLWQSQVQTMQPAPPAAYSWTGDNSRRFIGRVKSFSGANGYGFLTGPDILSVFGADIFVHQLEVDKLTNMAKCPIPCGTAVSFTVVPNKKGQPQARELRYEQPMPPAPGTGPGGNATMAAIQAAMLNTHGQPGFQDYNSSMPGTYSQGGSTLQYPTEGHHPGQHPALPQQGGAPHHNEGQNSPMEKFKSFVETRYGNEPYDPARGERSGERRGGGDREREDEGARTRRRSRSPRGGNTSTQHPASGRPE